jgi:hypothetical protein
MSEYRFPDPFIRNTNTGKWYVFPDTVLDNMDLSDCNDTITGICMHTNTLNECLDLCGNSNFCKGGYYIKAPDRNYCVPLKNYEKEALTPYYRYRHQSLYPELKGLKVYVFNSTQDPYPPNFANVIFYTDHFVMQDSSTKTNIGYLDDLYDLDKQNDLDDGTEDVDETSRAINLRFLPGQLGRNYVEHYVSVKSGDKVIINIPNTAFVLHRSLGLERGENINVTNLPSNSGLLNWVLGAAVTNIPVNTFVIEGVDENGQVLPEGSLLTYSNMIRLYHNSEPVYYKDGLLLAGGDTPTDFKLIPKVQVYYCKNEQTCARVGLEDTDKHGPSATYMGKPVSRNPACWNKCGKLGLISNLRSEVLPREARSKLEQNTHKNIRTALVITCMIAAIIIIIVIVVYVLRNRKAIKYMR